MKVYITLLALVAAIAGFEYFRGKVTDTTPDFVASFPANSPLHGHEAEVLADFHTEQAQWDREDRAAAAAASAANPAIDVEATNSPTTRPTPDALAAAITTIAPTTRPTSDE